LQWKNCDIGKAFFSSIQERIEDLKEELITTNSIEDVKYRQGAIMCAKDILDVSLDTKEDE